MELPVTAASAEPVTTLPSDPGWWFEPVFDGRRLLVHRLPAGPRLLTRTGRDLGGAWPALVRAAHRLAPGTVLDGAAVLWRDGALDPAAARNRTGPAGPDDRPGSYAAFDLLAHPSHGDVRRLPWTERRLLLLDLLDPLGPPLQPVPAADDHETALLWYESLREQGVEAVVAKRGDAPYGAPGAWRTLRHEDRVPLPVVGYLGASVRPKRLVVRLPDGRHRATGPLTPETAARAADFLTEAGPGRRSTTEDGEPYAGCAVGLTAEVTTGPARHAEITVLGLGTAPPT
ncbi:hypothetical protein [Streptomyces sp. NPDC097619]|uniref:ATP-dependent DNA ligase n=1 Tax=Streptomyces sp. NPDC097619 TaxID=3157228 RepID=UPI00332F2976